MPYLWLCIVTRYVPVTRNWNSNAVSSRYHKKKERVTGRYFFISKTINFCSETLINAEENTCGHNMNLCENFESCLE